MMRGAYIVKMDFFKVELFRKDAIFFYIGHIRQHARGYVHS